MVGRHNAIGICVSEILCPERILPESPHLVYVPGDVTPGAVASFACELGYRLVNSSDEIRCSPMGYWSGVLPHCGEKA